MNDAYEKGRSHGYEDRKPLVESLLDNPYPPQTNEHAQWALGCEHGFTEWFAE